MVSIVVSEKSMIWSVLNTALSLGVFDNSPKPSYCNNGNCYWNIIGFIAVKGRRNRNYEVIVLLFFDFSILGSEDI